jgi:peptidoglycan/LPS O-acetylase OafA/YrhL
MKGAEDEPALAAQRDRTYFPEITGLRFYLALWVAAGHALQLSGFLKRSNPLFAFLHDNNSAVILFMIVSGFVITHLLTVKQEAYGPYIVRRFWRLFPAFLVGSIIGYWVLADWVGIVRLASWSGMAGWREYAASIEEIAAQSHGNPIPHSLLHLTMLHGLVPNEVLDRAAMTFLPAAWSISLEWQFYLVAPLVIASLTSRRLFIAVAGAALGLLLAYKRGWLGTYDIGGSLLGSSYWFAIGIASRLLFERLCARRVSPYTAIPAAWLLIVGLSDKPLPLLIWAAFYILMLWDEPNSPLRRAFAIATTSRPVVLLGEASYSLYLIHRPIQVLVGSYLMTNFRIDRLEMLGGQALAVLIAIPVSILMYFAIERPGFRLGQHLAKRLPGRRNAALPYPAPAAMKL